MTQQSSIFNFKNMSVVAVRKTGRGKWEAAADSIQVQGWTQEKNKDAKLNRVGQIIAGSAGYASIGNLMDEYLANHQPKTNTHDGWVRFLVEFSAHCKAIDDKLEMREQQFLFVWRVRAWFAGYFCVEEVREFAAVGAGRDFALAAMHLGHSAERAVAVACDLSVYCERPIKKLTAEL